LKAAEFFSEKEGTAHMLKTLLLFNMMFLVVSGCTNNELASAGRTGETVTTVTDEAGEVADDPLTTPASSSAGTSIRTSHDMGSSTENISPPPPDNDEVSEPISIAGAYLSCITSPDVAGSGVNISCALKNIRDHSLIALPPDTKLNKAALLGTESKKIDLIAQPSPDPAWHWIFTSITANLTDYKLFVLEITASNIAAGRNQGYFLDPTRINSVTPTQGIDGGVPLSSGTPLAYSDWEAGEPNNHKGRVEDCLDLRDYGDGKPENAVFKWNDQECNYSLFNFACQSKTNPLDWMISEKTGYWHESAGKCPATHKFSIPINKAQNDALVARAKVFFNKEGKYHTVWMNGKKVVSGVQYHYIP
jgi:hypothetical protein